jgi:membrane-associated protease RseP (regulator of RpoE activity)
MKKFPIWHIVFFIATSFTTLTAGAVIDGIDVIKEPSRIIEGFPFAVTLMTILLTHELSHYLASRRNNTHATLPFFIPGPPFYIVNGVFVPLIGTFGAFIKMKSPILTRQALVEIGASGPLAGFAISVIACIIGLNISTVVSISAGTSHSIANDSLLFWVLSKSIIGIIPNNAEILPHPIAYAGWLGLFVTSLNLIPVGQLDGGHIAFALLGDKHKHVSVVLIIILALMGIFVWEGWAIWAGLLILLGIKHPPILYWELPLDRRRKRLGLIALIVFVITFVPCPFKVTL